MAINKIEYLKDSSTVGFATAGDEKTINKTSAKTIKTDADEGNTKDLTNGQQRYLQNSLNNSDNTSYESTGDTTIPEDGEETNPEDEKGNKTNDKDNKNQYGSAISTAASMATLEFGILALANSSKLTAAMNTITAPVVGGIDSALAGAGLAGVLTFDSDFNNRSSEYSAADEDINTINAYMDVLNQDIENMNAAQVPTTTPTEGTEGTTEEKEDQPQDTATILSDLYAQLETAKSEENQELIDKLTAQIAEIEASIQTTPNEATGETQEGNILEIYTANNSEAHDISDYSLGVSQFLREGTGLGAMGTMNTVALAGCSAVSAVLAIKAWQGATIFTLASSAVGAALCGAAAGVFAGASAAMGIKSAKEFKFGNKGRDISSAIGNIQQPLAEHDKIVQELQKSQQKTETTPTPTTTETPTPTETAPTGGDSTTGGDGSTSGGNSPTA